MIYNNYHSNFLMKARHENRNNASNISIKVIVILLINFIVQVNQISAQTDSTEITEPKIKARLVVSFNSICCGIDKKINNEFLNLVNNYPKKAEYKVYYWGREGEMDYCFGLQDFSARDQKKFIKKVKKTVGKSRMVTLQQNIPCPR